MKQSNAAVVARARRRIPSSLAAAVSRFAATALAAGLLLPGPALSRMRPVVTLVVATLSLGPLSMATPSAALADCSQLDPWPSFRQAAPSATTILIGTVTWTPGGRINNRFMLRVDEVLRGTAPNELEIAALHSGLPETICPGDSSLTVRRVGERLALAYGAHLPGQRRTITAVAFVKPSRPHHFFLPRMERLSAAEVRAIAAAPPPTDTAPSVTSPEQSPSHGIGTGLPWTVGLAAFLVALFMTPARAARLLQHGSSRSGPHRP